MTVPIIIILSMGPLDPIEFGLDRGDGFDFSTLIDENGDGRIELLLPLNSTVALGINQTSAGYGDYLLWDIQGSQISNNILPFEIPVFVDTEGGSLGIDYGTLRPPPVPFAAGNTFSVALGQLSLWPELRFIDTTGVGDLRDFVAGRSTLPNFVGLVVVSDLRIRVVPEPGVMTLSLVCLVAVASRRSKRAPFQQMRDTKLRHLPALTVIGPILALLAIGLIGALSSRRRLAPQYFDSAWLAGYLRFSRRRVWCRRGT